MTRTPAEVAPTVNRSNKPEVNPRQNASAENTHSAGDASIEHAGDASIDRADSAGDASIESGAGTVGTSRKGFMLFGQIKVEFTLPNLLTFFRILLIPVIVWLYHFKDDAIGAFCVLVLSGITDIADGFIARRFNMISDFGKALDPIADKLTQAAVLGCLGWNYPFMFLIFGVMLFKETVLFFMAYFVFKKTKAIHGSSWHGKIATAMIYATLLLYMLPLDLPHFVEIMLAILCSIMIMISFFFYLNDHAKRIKAAQKES